MKPARYYTAAVSLEALPEVLLFDLDDTIVQFSVGQPNCWQLALEQIAPERMDHAALLEAIAREGNDFWAPTERAFWGRQNMHAARRIIARAALCQHGIDIDRCDRIADEMTERKEALVRPFDGALDVLAALRERGHRLGLLTNGSGEFQRRKLARFTLEPLFDLILIEGELGYGKPDGRVFAAALAHFAVSPPDSCMIGDNLEADIAGARDAGIATVWHDAYGVGLPHQSLVRGAQPTKPTVTPDRVIRHLSELLAWKFVPRSERRHAASL
jgi:putative hydrolase of the HAD superfamily